MASFAQLGIMLGVYAGSRWLNPPRPPTPDTDNTTTAEVPRTGHQHHLVISSITAASTALGYLFLPQLSLINLALLTYGAVPMLNRVENSLRNGNGGHEAYNAAIAGLCLGSGQYLAGAVHNVVYHLGGRMVESSRHAADASMKNALTTHPTPVWQARGTHEVQVNLSGLHAGDIVAVRAGETVPVTGWIVRGGALVSLPTATRGEKPIPQAKKIGDRVSAAAWVWSGQLHVQAETDGAESQRRQVHALLGNAAYHATTMQKNAEAWANHAVLPLATVSMLLWPLAGIAPATALLFGATSNTTRDMLAVHTANHLRWAAEQGFLLRDPSALDKLLWIDTLVFDQSSVTHATPQTGAIIPLASLPAARVVQLAITALQHQRHPIADALRAHVAPEHMPIDEAPVMDEIDNVAFGVSAQVNGQQTNVGNLLFFKKIIGDFDIPTELARAMRLQPNATWVLVAQDAQLQGAIALLPRVRAEIPAALAALRQRGPRRLLLVSTHAQNACDALAQTLGLDEAHGGLDARGKRDFIATLQAQGRRVGFISNGNARVPGNVRVPGNATSGNTTSGLANTLAMQQADLAIYLATCDVALPSVPGAELAHIILTPGSLARLRDVWDMAARLHLHLGSSLGLWTGFGLLNALCIPLLGFGPLHTSLLYASLSGLGLRHAALSLPQPPPPPAHGLTLDGEWTIAGAPQPSTTHCQVLA